jgi:hypothetical protein
MAVKGGYLKFTTKQRLYLNSVFNVNQTPNYNEILLNISLFDINNQITKKRIKIYFKNKRYICRKKNELNTCI